MPRWFLRILALLPAALAAGCQTPPAADMAPLPAWVEPADRAVARRIQWHEAALRQTISIDLRRATLQEAIDAIARRARLDIRIDWPELRRAGFHPQRRADLLALHGPARQVLTEALQRFRDPPAAADSSSSPLAAGPNFRGRGRGRGPGYDFRGRITPAGIVIGTRYSDVTVPFDPRSVYSAYNLLRQTEVLAAHRIGPAGREPTAFTALRVILSAPYARAVLDDLLRHGTPAARLYALCGLHHIDPAAFEARLYRFREQAEPVAVLIGASSGMLMPVDEAVELVPYRIAPPHAFRRPTPAPGSRDAEPAALSGVAPADGSSVLFR